MYIPVEEKTKDEQRKIIGIEPSIDIKHFALLLLVDLASKSQIIYFDSARENIKTACIPFDYKEIISEIMYEENGWGIEFAELINIHSYYEFQMDWEQKLGRKISEVIKELNKEIVCDFEYEYFNIDFTVDEIERIKSDYDQKVLDVMDHFSNFIIHPCRSNDSKNKFVERDFNRFKRFYKKY